MRITCRFLMLIVGAVILAAGSGLFWWAHSAISQGTIVLQGTGIRQMPFQPMPFQPITVSTTSNSYLIYQGIGIFGMVFGGILLVLGIVTAFRGNFAVISSHGASMKKSSDALDIAKERYAKGEISQEEFKTIRKILG